MSEHTVEGDRAIVQAFVTGTLGCGCAAEVFRQIECSCPRADRSEPNYLRILIGRRLLIYAVEVLAEDPVFHWLPSLVAQGSAERDAQGYNRFRLVVFMMGAANCREELESEFARRSGADGKVHLHILPPVPAWEPVRAALEASFMTG